MRKSGKRGLQAVVLAASLLSAATALASDVMVGVRVIDPDPASMPFAMQT